jgi:hypothetical protein
MTAKYLMATTLASFAVLGAAIATPTRSDDLLQALSKSKHSLVDGIKQLSKAPTEAISAKFELEDGKLSLSVYTVAKGLDVDAEHNVLQEVAGSPEADAWTPEAEVFKDVEHVSRSSTQLTLMSLSKLSLLDVLKKAEKDQTGTAYSITPVLQGRKAVFSVLVAAQGKSVEVQYDLATGDRIKK